MSHSIPACVTKIVHVSIKYIHVSTKLVVFSFFVHTLGVASGEETLWQTFLLVHPQTPCPMNRGVGRLWRRERSWRKRRTGSLSFSSCFPCHIPHPLTLTGLGLRSQLLHRSGAPEHHLWATSGCLGCGSSCLCF